MGIKWGYMDRWQNSGHIGDPQLCSFASQSIRSLGLSAFMHSTEVPNCATDYCRTFMDQSSLRGSVIPASMAGSIKNERGFVKLFSITQVIFHFGCFALIVRHEPKNELINQNSPQILSLICPNQYVCDTNLWQGSRLVLSPIITFNTSCNSDYVI